MPEHSEVSLVGIVYVDCITGRIEGISQHAVAFHLANVFCTRPETRHIEPLDLIQPCLCCSQVGEDILVVGITWRGSTGEDRR